MDQGDIKRQMPPVVPTWQENIRWSELAIRAVGDGDLLREGLPSFREQYHHSLLQRCVPLEEIVPLATHEVVTPNVDLRATPRARQRSFICFNQWASEPPPQAQSVQTGRDNTAEGGRGGH